MAFWRDGSYEWVPGHWRGLTWVRADWRKKGHSHKRTEHDLSFPIWVLLGIIVLLYWFGAAYGAQLPRLFP